GDSHDTLLKIRYHIDLLLPLLFLPLASPLALMTAAPIMVEHLLSSRANQHMIIYQYTAPVTPALIVATVLGVRNLARALNRIGSLARRPAASRGKGLQPGRGRAAGHRRRATTAVLAAAALVASG